MTEPKPFFDAIEELQQTPSLRPEMEAVHERLQAHAAPCGDRAVIEALTPLITLYGVADKSKAEWSVFWRFYIEALRSLPIAALQAGVRDYVAKPDSEFFPKPGPLRALCEPHAALAIIAYRRVHRALGFGATP